MSCELLDKHPYYAEQTNDYFNVFYISLQRKVGGGDGGKKRVSKKKKKKKKKHPCKTSIKKKVKEIKKRVISIT